MTVKRAVSYCRISTASQIDNTSIETQDEKIELYCKLNDIEIVKKFCDEGFSAKSTNRKAYKEMLEFILDKENNIDTIIVMKSDRIHRSLKNLVDMMYNLQEKNIEFISVTENFDTSTPQGVLMLQMLGSFSEFERKVIAERTKSGRVANIKNQVSPGGRPPLGYKMVDKRLVIDEKEANIVREIFKLRNKGFSFSKIGKEVNMHKQTVCRIIKNKIYTGEFNYNGEIENNNAKWKVDRIVSNYTFNKANNNN